MSDLYKCECGSEDFKVYWTDYLSGRGAVQKGKNGELLIDVGSLLIDDYAGEIQIDEVVCAVCGKEVREEIDVGVPEYE